MPFTDEEKTEISGLFNEILDARDAAKAEKDAKDNARNGDGKDEKNNGGNGEGGNGDAGEPPKRSIAERLMGKPLSA